MSTVRSDTRPAAARPTPGPLTCRACGSDRTRTFLDLGESPLSNALLAAEDLSHEEARWPLHVRVCSQCLLVQLPTCAAPASIFDAQYAYFSSFSDTWLAHARTYAHKMREQLQLGPQSLVVEVASNDGYLLRWFHEAGVPVLGIEPSANTAEAARKLGIETRVEFFGRECAARLRAEGRRADLMAANNVLAHVPDLHDFVAGFAELLAPDGVATFEFPHVLQLVDHVQFDTIYHEHYSYLSLLVVEDVLARHELRVHDVEELWTHGGSLRVHASHVAADRPRTARVTALRDKEEVAGLGGLDGYSGFAARVEHVKEELVGFLTEAKRNGRRVAGYGAPAKATTLLNACGIGPELLPFTVDRSPHKQGRFIPGARIPIHAPEKLLAEKPDVVLILPWNIRDEIVEQMAAVRGWGGQFAVPIPRLELV